MIKIKLLVEMLVLGGGNRFYFYVNKKVNYRREKQNYNTFTPYDLTILSLRLACCSPWVHKVSNTTERLN